jgi:hypothetical protein
MLKAVILVGICAGPCSSDILYQVTVDTSTVSGLSGYVDFQFNPGDVTTQPAFVQISNFTPGSSLSGAPRTTGSVAGALPGLVQIDNTSAFNDYFQAFAFGNALSFFLDFGGPAVNTPNGTSTSGSSFGLTLCNDANCLSPLQTTDLNGFVATVNINLDGTTIPTTFPASPGGPPAATLVAELIPEPPTMFSMAHCSRDGSYGVLSKEENQAVRVTGVVPATMNRWGLPTSQQQFLQHGNACIGAFGSNRGM